VRKYIDKSESYLAIFEDTESYYKEEIESKKELIFQVKSDEEDFIGASRSLILVEMECKAKINILARYRLKLDAIKNDLKIIINSVEDNSIEIKNIKNLLDDDDSNVFNFELQYKTLLNKFGYRSNDAKNIKINRTQVSNLLPVIESKIDFTPSYQPIRLSSSASDFIRSLWAYYMSLVTTSKVHPGFLVLDEPGQHAMKSESMKSLLTFSKGIKSKQIILALSKDLREKDDGGSKDYSLADIVGDSSDVNIIDIENNEFKRCIHRL
jgi:hypothetical protein